MGKGQSIPTDPIFYLAFIVLLFMAIAANVGDDTPEGAEAEAGMMGSASIAFSNAFDQIFGAGERPCMFLKDEKGIIHDPFPKEMANWQCILIFGMLPFTILYYFMFDILAFTMITDRTRNIIALAIAIFAVQLKFLINVTNFLAELTGGVLGGSFSLFGLLIVMGIAGSLLGQFGVTMKTAADATYGTGEVIYGLRTMKAIGRSVSQKRR